METGLKGFSANATMGISRGRKSGKSGLGFLEMWARVWDNRNKGPVTGWKSDIRNETPGPLVRNEYGDRNLDFEAEIKVYFRGRRNPTPDG